MKASRILLSIWTLAFALGIVGCTVVEDDKPDTTIVKPDKPDVIITPPAPDNKPN